MQITITGPRSVGKTTISKLVAKKLKLQYYSSDEIGEKHLKKYGGLDKAIKSGIIAKFIDKSAYGLIRNVYKKENFVFDLSGGSISSTKHAEASKKVREVAIQKSIVIGLLPSKKQNESIKYIFEREQNRLHFKDLNKDELLTKTKKDYKKFPPIFQEFCNFIIYTKDKTPKEISDEIVKNINPTIKPLYLKPYFQVYKFLQNNLHLVRTEEFLKEKLKEFPQYFKGLYLDDKLIGVIQGYPRDDYILISEIAIDQKFRKKGYGSKLVKAFEKEIHNKKIKVGAQDNSISFYKSLNFKPSIFMQFKKENFNQNILKDYKILYQKEYAGLLGIEIEIKKISLNQINKFKDRLKPYSIQYLFTK